MIAFATSSAIWVGFYIADGTAKERSDNMKMDYKGYASVSLTKFGRNAECMCDTCLAAVAVIMMRWLVELAVA